MDFKKKPMVDWYDPKQLAATGIKTVVSTVFGNFADRREMQAALDPGRGFYDYSDRTDIWLDFISDLGDGFNATYSVAHLLAKDQLELDGIQTKRGNILVMGGDQVYPTPEIDEYRNRLQGPYHAAFPKDNSDLDPPGLFVIPGNHDWYDGLTNFLKIFCQGRSLGNWRTKQSRSYFAVKLPNHYWLIGIDIQLNADIDVPQLNYFQNLAEKELKSDDKIILATAEPAWVYESFDESNSSNKRLKFFINRILKGETDDKTDPECYYRGKNKDIEITTILTGDLHHYSRYEENVGSKEPRQLITAGGGGAFMHTTHSLKEKIKPSEGFDATFQKAFPSKSESLSLNNKNLLFFIHGPWMVLILGLVHALSFYFLLISGIQTENYNIALSDPTGTTLDLLGIAILTPSVILLNLLFCFGIYMFTDFKSGNFKTANKISGAVHGLSHVFVFYLCLVYLPAFNSANLTNVPFQPLILFVEMWIVGGLLSGFIFGIYLWFSSRFLDNHITEASSSFKGEDFKNFIRIHISAKELTIYPVGIRSVVKNWKNVGDEKNPRFEGDEVKFELIEAPIHIPKRP
ncbi:metallophosphoesterase [Cognataquiflexum rubidum]|uniref:metallophosphoesterase n=1 Tax=Cognataquiflexum rubidum TaxID=2922273 RepID=UPI001F13C6D2|nr:metallophosphoesterase [Cognataquiflexum rubidum]MCH6236438.1 metallophosphoesterase [Cognataquiflexum rubidum]